MNEWQGGVGKRTMSKRTASAWNVFVVADITCKSGGVVVGEEGRSFGVDDGKKFKRRNGYI